MDMERRPLPRGRCQQPGGHRRRGIYLISTLLLLTFLVIIGGAVMVSFSQGLSAATAFNNRQLALQAAMSGLTYVQARIETNVRSFAPQPDGVSASLVSGLADAPFQVTEQGWRVAGLMSNGSLAGAEASPVRVMFRASFNSSYTAFAASNDWSFVRDWSPSLPPIPQVSVNNLSRTAASPVVSYYAGGGAFQVVPGGMADIIVEGLALGPGGNVLARRTVEAMWRVDQMGGMCGGASSSGVMTLELGASGGLLSVQTTDPASPLASNSGLACLSNIVLVGRDAVPPGATAPPQHANGSIASPGVDSSGAGSAQLAFSQGTGTSTPQFRSSGSITVVGNVVGLGSLVTTGQAGGATVPGDITVVGKSSLDSRPDSGIALYASGSLNFWQLSQAQAPAAVPEVGATFEAAGIVPGSGGTGTGGATITDLRAACDASLARAMAAYIDANPSKRVSSPATSPGVYLNTTTNKYQIAYTSTGEIPAEQIRDMQVSVSYNGVNYSGELKKVLYRLVNGAGASGELTKLQVARVLCPPVGGYVPPALPPNLAAINAMANDPPWTWTSPASAGGAYSAFIAAEVFQKYVASGTHEGGGSSPTPTATPTASPTTGAGTVAGAPLDQSFNGLVYAHKNITMQNRLGSLRINGAMAAYGGDPSRDAPGAGGGGEVNLLANNITITYNPAVLGPFASFLGGQVGLERTFVTVY